MPLKRNSRKNPGFRARQTRTNIRNNALEGRLAARHFSHRQNAGGRWTTTATILDTNGNDTVKKMTAEEIDGLADYIVKTVPEAEILEIQTAKRKYRVDLRPRKEPTPMLDAMMTLWNFLRE